MNGIRTICEQDSSWSEYDTRAPSALQKMHAETARNTMKAACFFAFPATASCSASLFTFDTLESPLSNQRMLHPTCLYRALPRRGRMLTGACAQTCFMTRVFHVAPAESKMCTGFSFSEDANLK